MLQSRKRKRESRPTKSKVKKESNEGEKKATYQPNVSINTKSKLASFSAPDAVSIINKYVLRVMKQICLPVP